jgi:hypothetical protein
MKKKISLVALMAGLLSAGVVVPAQAADPTDPAPTNVQISWKDDTYKFVHVTWDEDSARPNKVFVRWPGSTMRNRVKFVAADAPNAVDLPAEFMWQVGALLEVGVTVGDAAGETSPVAVSVPFDTIDAGAPVITSYQPSGTSTLQVSWKQGTPTHRDTTPGDPLDLDLPVKYQAAYQLPDGTTVPVGQRSTSTTATVVGPNPPYTLRVRAANEWMSVENDGIRAHSSAFTTSIPAWVVAGQNTVIRGTFDGPETSTQVTLQARSTATSAWYAVGSNHFPTGSYQFTVPSRGTRQYRIVVGNTTSNVGRDVWFGGYSAPVTTTTQLKATVSLAASTVSRSSTPVNAALTVNPASTGTASLQRWNGSTWVAVANVPFTSGRGTGHLSAATAGTFTYRYYVPAQTYNGLSVAAAYSPNFTLTVKP